MFDKLLHNYLRLPYTLHVHEYRKVKKPSMTIVFLHGIGNSGSVWGDVISKLPSDVSCISVDLLGFGQSPMPPWAKYDARTQARSVVATLTKLRRTKKMVFVGHSLGALAAVEVAKVYPQYVKELILCSPPFYIPSDHTHPLRPKADKLLRQLYRNVRKNPNRLVRVSTFAMRYRLVNHSFNVTSDNVDSYMVALESMIINQTSFDDVSLLAKPVHIIRGTLDPLVVASNIRKLKKMNKNISFQSVVAGHEVKGRYQRAVLRRISDIKPAKRVRAQRMKQQRRKVQEH